MPKKSYEIAMQWVPQELKEPFVEYCVTVAKKLMRIFEAHEKR
jgi:hypothetical protein